MRFIWKPLVLAGWASPNEVHSYINTQRSATTKPHQHSGTQHNSTQEQITAHTHNKVHKPPVSVEGRAAQTHTCRILNAGDANHSYSWYHSSTGSDVPYKWNLLDIKLYRLADLPNTQNPQKQEMSTWYRHWALALQPNQKTGIPKFHWGIYTNCLNQL